MRLRVSRRGGRGRTRTEDPLKGAGHGHHGSGAGRRPPGAPPPEAGFCLHFFCRPRLFEEPGEPDELPAPNEEGPTSTGWKEVGVGAGGGGRAA